LKLTAPPGASHDRPAAFFDPLAHRAVRWRARPVRAGPPGIRARRERPARGKPDPEAPDLGPSRHPLDRSGLAVAVLTIVAVTIVAVVAVVAQLVVAQPHSVGEPVAKPPSHAAKPDVGAGLEPGPLHDTVISDPLSLDACTRVELTSTGFRPARAPDVA
jgi:hypothetical protein